MCTTPWNDEMAVGFFPSFRVLSLLEQHRWQWEEPFGQYNFSKILTNRSLRRGKAVNIGPYPNEVLTFLFFTA